MSYAFLFLTYDNFVNKDIIKQFTKDQNIYIHPKFPNNVDSYFKSFIINDLIETKWGEISIVYATINLLKEAYKNENNKWFILLSQDSYPLYDFTEFDNLFNKIHNNKSIFNFKSIYDKYYKTSQWFILCRNDVKIILDNYLKYDKFFETKYDKLIGAYDEIYFLTLLMLVNNNYKYTDYNLMYTKWLDNTTQKSPLYFNKLLLEDKEYIKKNNCLFIRKITNIFTLNIYKPKKKLYVIFIGTVTDQNINFNDEFDIILLISVDIKTIKKEIIDKAIYIINIIYFFYYESILDLINQPFIQKWSIIVFTSELFRINNYNKLEKIKKKLPYNNFKFLKKPIINKSIFYYIKDYTNQLAFCIKNY